MLTLKDLEKESNKIADYYAELQQRIFLMILDVTDNQRALLTDKKNILQWRLECLSNMGVLTQQVIKAVQQTTHKSKKDIETLLKNNGLQIADDINQQLQELLNKNVNVSPAVDQIIDGYIHQTFLDISNNVNQTLLSTNYDNNQALITYQDIINQTVLETTTGLKAPQQAFRDNIYKWNKQGIKTSLVDKGGHHWSLEGYTKLVMNTTANRMFNDIRINSMKEFDSPLAVMSSHPASRPACAPIQGKIINVVPESDNRYDDEYDTIYNHGYGTPRGTLGINCCHMLKPYVKGVSHNYEKQYDPDEAIKNADVLAKQRRYERAIRKWKYEKQLADKLGDQIHANECGIHICDFQGKLRELVKKHDFLNRDYGREQIYGKVSAPDLTSGEKAALNRYVSSDSYKINNKLRNNMQLNSDDKELINNLDSALEKFPKYTGDKPLQRSYFFDDLQEQNQFLNELYLNGGLNDKAFISTSKKNYGEGQEQVNMIIKDSHNGADISSLNRTESEILFPRNTKFILHSIHIKNGIITVEVSEHE